MHDNYYNEIFILDYQSASEDKTCMKFLRKLAYNIPYIKAGELSRFDALASYINEQLKNNLEFFDRNKNLDYETLNQYRDIVIGYKKHFDDILEAKSILDELMAKIDKDLESRKGFLGKQETNEDKYYQYEVKGDAYQEENAGLEKLYQELAGIYNEVARASKISDKDLENYNREIADYEKNIKDIFDYIMKRKIKGKGFGDVTQNFR